MNGLQESEAHADSIVIHYVVSVLDCHLRTEHYLHHLFFADLELVSIIGMACTVDCFFCKCSTFP